MRGIEGQVAELGRRVENLERVTSGIEGSVSIIGSQLTDIARRQGELGGSIDGWKAQQTAHHNAVIERLDKSDKFQNDLQPLRTIWLRLCSAAVDVLVKGILIAAIAALVLGMLEVNVSKIAQAVAAAGAHPQP
ncbi:hypothetical protein JL101_035960 (plasmid) [Skermanella rosea]|uniref:hypothetical protein n=1 Tax=Skermanella rosea TaxID=1817965 RepID=UPI001931C1AC|nr:hypothetical protein [Skermanella rosea]UEM08049.1 hypothetical protein JL101_035960 [Skermanella rosea]